MTLTLQYTSISAVVPGGMNNCTVAGTTVGGKLTSGVGLGWMGGALEVVNGRGGVSEGNWELVVSVVAGMVGELVGIATGGWVSADEVCGSRVVVVTGGGVAGEGDGDGDGDGDGEGEGEGSSVGISSSMPE